MAKNLFFSLLTIIVLAACQLRQKSTDGERVDDQEPVSAGQPAEDQAPPSPETPQGSFVRKIAPKLGVILGGGGVLTYAQIGVLRELMEQKIKVHAITGLEWGALVAATYSLNSQAHEAEWQLLKLPFKKFKGFGVFSSSAKVDVNVFAGFLKQIFKNREVNSGEIPFSCPYLDLKAQRIEMARNGKFQEVLKMCWPYEPLFAYRSQMASPLGIREAARYLRSQGAQVILYVDVIDENSLFSNEQQQKFPAANLLWLQVKSFSAAVKDLGVDEVIGVSLGSTNYMAYESMRPLVRMGQLKSRALVKDLVNKYEY